MNQPYKLTIFLFLLLASTLSVKSQSPGHTDAIYSGLPWFDDRGEVISAHAAGILKDNGRYWLFGECHSDTSNAFAGFNCYSSKDLYNWKFENQVLPIQNDGKLGPNRVGERPKVLKCPKTGEYVMFMHVDNMTYTDQYIGYATSNTVNGTYTFRGPLLMDGQPIRKWDMGIYQESDGTAYLLTHSGNIYLLNDDYKSVASQVVKEMGHGEAPTVFKKNGIYFWLTSDLTSWERNDNFYYTATSMQGPWIRRGFIAPKGSLTWNSQSTFVLSVAGSKDTVLLFMGDRWAFPRQRSAATYVWQPITVRGDSLMIPEYQEGWQIDPLTGRWSLSPLRSKRIDHSDTRSIHYTGRWRHSLPGDSLQESRSDEKGAAFTVKFTGTRIGCYSVARPDGGYARITLQDTRGKTLLTSTIEMYCKYPERSLKFLSPILPKGDYLLTVTVLGEHGNWSNKKGDLFGSTGNKVSLSSIVIQQ